MQLEKVDCGTLLNTDLVPYIKLENSLTGQLSSHTLRVGMVEWHVTAGEDRSVLRVTLEQRAWFYLGCISLFARWADADPAGRFCAIDRYVTLRDWMTSEVYAVIPSSRVDHECPLQLNYEAWIREHLGAVLADDVVNRLDRAGGEPMRGRFIDPCGWNEVVDALIEIVGDLETQEAFLNRPIAEAHFPSAVDQTDVRLRREAQAWAQRIFPQWVGKTVPLEHEPQLLATLAMMLLSARFGEVEALAYHGLSLSMGLSADTWTQARGLILAEFRKRCQRRTPDVGMEGQPSLFPVLSDIESSHVGGF